MIAAQYQTIVCEDLNVAGMLQNGKLARAISDQGFGTVRRMLDYKTGWRGGQLIKAGRFYPSSKTCSACGAVKAKLALSERVFTCDTCGLVTNRDVNAARNLRDLAASGAERLNACRDYARLVHDGQWSSKQEPGAASAGRTGTAPRQRMAAASASKADPQRSKLKAKNL
jgi:putative transposase